MRDVDSQTVSVLLIKGRGPTYPEEQFWSRTAKLRTLDFAARHTATLSQGSGGKVQAELNVHVWECVGTKCVNNSNSLITVMVYILFGNL